MEVWQLIQTSHHDLPTQAIQTHAHVAVPAKIHAHVASL